MPDGIEKLAALSTGITPGNSEPRVTADDMSSFDFGLSPEQINAMTQFQSTQDNQEGPLPWKLNQSDYYPGFHQGPIGQNSDMFGSYGVYSAGANLVPMAVLDAHEQAIRNAAFKRAKEVNDFKTNFKTPQSKLTNINDKLGSDYINFTKSSFQKALKAAGGNPQVARQILDQSPEFQERLNSYENAAKLGDAVSDKMAKLYDEQKSGRFTFTPTLTDAMQKLTTSLDPSSPDFKNQANRFMTMNAEYDFAHALDEVSKKAFATESGRSSADLNDPEFIKEYQSSRKEWTNDQKDQIADLIYNTRYVGSDYFTPERVKKYVYSALTGVSTTSKTNVKERRDDGAGSGISLEDIAHPDEVAKINGKSLLNTDVSGIDYKKGKNIYGIEAKDASYSTFDGATIAKPIPIIMPVNSKGFDNTTGELDKEMGNVNAEVGGVFNAFVFNAPGKDHDGRMVPDDLLESGNLDAKDVKVVPMASIIYHKKGNKQSGEQTTEDHSVNVPLASIKNVLTRKGGKSAEAIAEMERRAKSRNDQSQSKETPATTSTQEAPATPAAESAKKEVKASNGKKYKGIDPKTGNAIWE